MKPLPLPSTKTFAAMEARELRKEINEYINHADERFLRLVYSMVESEISEKDMFSSDNAEMRKRAEQSLESADKGNTRSFHSFKKDVDSWKQKRATR